MSRALPGFPRVSSHVVTVTLGDAVLRARFTYRDRSRSWYLDLHDADDVPLAVGRRLSPGWGPLHGLSVPGAPDGVFVVDGPDDYNKADLGADLRLVFVPRDELPDAPAGLSLTVTT